MKLLRYMSISGWMLFLNFSVFLMMAIFINSHNYRLSLRECRARKTLEHHSETDPLTGLYNRRKLDAQMQGIYSRQSFVLVVLDVDEFKQINDRLGHTVGDTCLEKTARILSARFGDRVYRLGGDEFAIVSDFDVAETCGYIDDINRDMEGIMEQFPLSVSAGLYTFREGDTQKEAFRKADKALYQTKKAGGAGWAVYEEETPG